MKAITTVLLCLLNLSLWGQRITVTGTVQDSETGEYLGFANVYVAGSTTGVATEPDGSFQFSFDASQGRELIASLLGYQDFTAVIPAKDTVRLRILLKPSELQLAEIVVLAGENPAHPIIRGLIARKPDNDRRQWPFYSASVYSKLEMDLINLPDGIEDTKLMRPFNFIFDNLDSLSDEQPFLPVYITESLSNVVKKKEWNDEREWPVARKVSGVENTSAVQFLDLVHRPFHLYDNWIPVLDKQFASPFSDGGFSYYEYYLIDSTQFNGRWAYKIKFKPRRKQEPTFFGECWIDKDDFAVRSVSMRIVPDANINLVQRLVISQDFNRNGTGYWIPVRDKTVLNLAPIKKAPGTIARKTILYNDVNTSPLPAWGEQKPVDPAMLELDQLERPNEFWSAARPEPLTRTEAKVYEMIDSIKNVPAYRKYKDLAYVLSTGYKAWGPLEIGPVFSVYSNNAVEGHRIRMGLGTSHQFSRKYYLYGYGAYGVDDKRFKYGGQFQVILKKRPWTTAGFSFKSDLELNYENSEETAEDNLFAGVYRRNVPQKLMYADEVKAYYEKNLAKGWNTRLAFQHLSMKPVVRDGGGFPFYYLDQPNSLDPDSTITNTELLFRARYAPKEVFLEGTFTRTSMGSKEPVPVLEFTYGAGLRNVLSSDYEYHRLNFTIYQWFNVPPAGWMRYRFNAGKIFGKLPYLLLRNSDGNETYFYVDNTFNAMNRYEFVADTYAELFFEHHMDGLLFNRIPLLRKLKWREVTTLKMAYGTLTDANQQANRLNHYDRSYTDYRLNPIPGEGVYYGTFDKGPYTELSAGIENIFKVIRIDGVWRLNYLDNRYASPFSLRGTLAFLF